MVTSPEDYIDYLKMEYPDIDKKVLKKIIDIGTKGLQDLIFKDHDVSFGNNHPGSNYKITFVRSTDGQHRRNQRAKFNKARLDTLRKNRSNGKKTIS